MATEEYQGPVEPNSFWVTAVTGVVIVAVAVGCLTLAAAVANEYEITKHVLRDIGIGLIVAAVIIFTIERKSRNELNSMVSRFLLRTHENLFQTILGVQFPKTMFDFVRDRLMKEPIFRTNTEVHYTIRNLDECDLGPLYGIQTVLLDVTSAYHLKNLSDREHKHPIRFFVEASLQTKEMPIPKLFVDGTQIPEDQLKHADTAWKDRPGQKRYEYELVMAPQEERNVEVRHSQGKLIADSEVWRSLHPCDGLRLSITHPPELAVMVDAMHPDDIVTIQENEVSYIGKISRPLFPANGFLFWWHPVTAPGAQAKEVIPERHSVTEN